MTTLDIDTSFITTCEAGEGCETVKEGEEPSQAQETASSPQEAQQEEEAAPAMS